MTDKEQQAAPPDAISTIIKILDMLEVGDREKVLAAVRAYFQPSESQTHQPPPQASTGLAYDRTPIQGQPQTFTIPKDIRTLREEKQPRTDIEMAAVMAYYLMEIVPPSERKDSVSAQDVETYFKQAGAKLPKHFGQTLINAKNAGYFESAGEGLFRLNPVGYNLVTHSLPKSSRDGKRKRKRKKSPTTKDKRTSGKSRAAQSKIKGKK